ncbi:Uncharacterised protein [Yersinia aldovae]|uniref:Uncharacterized protein n=1 Tax=Yersinia aldovae TaxID=29483 RepID=A0A0T9UW38_YERAL|nr:RhoGAP domain-containing protein [Yersinia aldovae]CNL77142.1 Uncharacterised protein [Yersinia aldovae]
MPTISQVPILSPQVKQELNQRLEGGKNENTAAAVSAPLNGEMRSVSVAETSKEAKSVGEGRKFFWASVTDFFSSIKDAFLKMFNQSPASSVSETTLTSVMDKHEAAVAQNEEIISIISKNKAFLETKGIMRISAAKLELDKLSDGKKGLQEATGVELAALFKKNIRDHMLPGDIKAIEQMFLDNESGKGLPSLSDLPKMAQGVIELAKKIAEHKVANSMPESNLATVIAPNLMSNDLLMKTMSFNTFVEKLILQKAPAESVMPDGVAAQPVA